MFLIANMSNFSWFACVLLCSVIVDSFEVDPQSISIWKMPNETHQLTWCLHGRKPTVDLRSQKHWCMWRQVCCCCFLALSKRYQDAFALITLDDNKSAASFQQVWCKLTYKLSLFIRKPDAKYATSPQISGCVTLIFTGLIDLGQAKSLMQLNAKLAPS